MVRKEPTARTVVVPETFFAALGLRLMQDFGPNAAENLLYEIGRDAGSAFVRSAERSHGRKLRSAEDIQDLLRMFGREYRWAEIEARSLDIPGKFAIVEWRDGVGVPQGGSQAPVCHLGRGLLSGAAGVIFDADCDAIETKCQAMGADHCEIVVGIPDRVTSVAERIE